MRMQSTWQWKCKVVDNDNAKNFSGRVCSPVWLLQDWLLCQNVQVRKEEIMFFPQSSLQLRDKIFWISPPSGIWETLSRKCQQSSSSPKRSRGWWQTAAVRRETTGWWATFILPTRKYLFSWVLVLIVYQGESGPWHVRLVRFRVQTGLRQEHQQLAFYQRRHRQ